MSGALISIPELDDQFAVVARPSRSRAGRPMPSATASAVIWSKPLDYRPNTARPLLLSPKAGDMILAGNPRGQISIKS